MMRVGRKVLTKVGIRRRFIVIATRKRLVEFYR
jgi:hypothetical protein